jgi:hypothetical protein
MTTKTADLKQQTWSGVRIIYEYVGIPAEGITIINSTAYHANGETRYVAILDGKVIAVQVGMGFCNGVVDPVLPWRTAFFPAYERRNGEVVYVIPVTNLA